MLIMGHLAENGLVVAEEFREGNVLETFAKSGRTNKIGPYVRSKDLGPKGE